jgi:1-acyl-sn-glycerol-3-phosphate acyltransferase
MSRLALALAGTRLAVSGRERLGDGAGVTVVNHASYLDALVLSALLPGAPVFVAKRDLAGQRIAGPFLRRLGVLFADRDLAQAGVREAQDFADRVRAGERLVIFPEATLRRMPGLLPFRLGAFVIACGTGTGVRPVVIRGTRSILRGEQWFPRRGRVEVEVLEALSPDGDDFAAAVRLRERTRSRMLAACGEPDLAGDDVGQIDHSGRQAGQRG